MATKDEILTALATLDKDNKDHWTQDGAPRLDALGIAGVKRGDVTAIAPLFNRSNPVLELPKKLEAEGKIGETMLLGSSIQPSSFKLKDGSSLTLGDVVAKAQEISGLSVEDWNKTAREAGETTEAYIQDVVDGLDLADDQEAEEEVNEPASAPIVERNKSPLLAERDAEKIVNDKAREVFQKAEKELQESDNRLNLLETRISDGDRGKTTQHDIQAYIRSQNQQRGMRHGIFESFKKSTGLVPQDLKAPVDAAMQRKNARGAKRPARGSKVEE